ncbi:DIS3-like exonuclease 2 [Diplonema papillatum]|nr:DIS3-like exonuclease 2 [Diplonema papillatum]
MSHHGHTVLVSERGNSKGKVLAMPTGCITVDSFADLVVDKFRLTTSIDCFYTPTNEPLHTMVSLREHPHVYFTKAQTQHRRTRSRSPSGEFAAPNQSGRQRGLSGTHRPPSQMFSKTMKARYDLASTAGPALRRSSSSNQVRLNASASFSSKGKRDAVALPLPAAPPPPARKRSTSPRAAPGKRPLFAAGKPRTSSPGPPTIKEVVRQQREQASRQRPAPPSRPAGPALDSDSERGPDSAATGSPRNFLPNHPAVQPPAAHAQSATQELPRSNSYYSYCRGAPARHSARQKNVEGWTPAETGAAAPALERMSSASHNSPRGRNGEVSRTRTSSLNSARAGGRRKSPARRSSASPTANQLLSLYSDYVTGDDLEAGFRKGEYVSGTLRTPRWADPTATVDMRQPLVLDGVECALMVTDSTACQQFCPNRNRALPGDEVVVKCEQQPVNESMASSLRLGDDKRPVILGTVVAVQKKSPVTVVYGVLSEDALLDPEAADGFGVVIPLNPAYPKLLIPARQLDAVEASRRLTVALRLEEEWPAASRLPHARLIGPIAEAATPLFLLEERLALAELNRLHIRRSGVVSDVFDEDVESELLATVSEGEPKLAADVAAGLLTDLRETVRPFVFASSTDLQAASAFSCSEETDGYRIGVHVIDVGSFIIDNGKIDTLLRRQVSTVTLPHSIHPLMPNSVQARLAFQPGQVKRCISVMWTVDGAGGNPRDVWAGQTAVNVRCLLRQAHYDSVTSSCPHLAVPICGVTEKDNPVTLLKEIASFIRLTTASRAFVPKPFPHHYLRRLNRPATGSDSLSAGVEALEDLSYISACPASAMDEMRVKAETAANAHLFSFVSLAAPADTIPVAKTCQPTSIFKSARDLPLCLQVFGLESAHRGFVDASLWSGASLHDTMREWTVLEEDANHPLARVKTTHVTSPFDRYVDIVTQRMVSMALKQSSEEEIAVPTGGRIIMTTPNVVSGIGRWRPANMRALLEEDAQHTMLNHAAYERMLDVMKKLSLEQAKGEYLQVHATFAGLDNAKQIAVWIPDWQLLKWGPLLTAGVHLFYLFGSTCYAIRLKH